jgi:hypothetical protein
VIGRSRHLGEERLYDCYLAACASEPLDPPAAEHLADCAECQARYAELEGFLEVLRGEAEAETDAIFSSEQLLHQKDQVLRRVDQLHRAARVISFPGGALPQMAGGPGRFAPRWVAAAAAAGLFVGVAVGSTIFSHETRPRTDRAMQVAVPAPRMAPQPAVLVSNPAPVVETVDDELFMSQLEMALARPWTRELMPFDALTPHARDQRNLR